MHKPVSSVAITVSFSRLFTSLPPSPYCLQPLGLEGPTFPELTSEAISNALADAGIPYTAVEAAVSECCVS